MSIVALMLLANGCALEQGTNDDSHDAAGPVGKTTGAVDVSCAADKYSRCIENVDPSGTITVKYYECVWSTVDHQPFSACEVEPDFVLVGGGAEIEGLTPSPGALLVGSWPANGAGTQVGNFWVAYSKDHLFSYPHRIRAHAVGLKLQGVSAANLYPQTFYASNESPPTLSHAPTVTALDNDSRDIIVGGGGYGVSKNGQGQLLVGSEPNGSNGWTVSSKDHVVSDPGRVVAAAIGIRRCPVGYVGGCLVATVSSHQIAPVSSGYSAASFLPPAGTLAVSVGGHAFYQGAGRMISSLFLVGNPGILVTKDHSVASSGVNVEYQISLSKQ